MSEGSTLSNRDPDHVTFARVEREMRIAPAARLAIAALAWAVAACATGPSPASPGPGLVAAPVGNTTDGPFTLEIRATKAVYSSEDPVVVTATLTYTGPDASAVISHGYGSPISIGVVEPVDGLSMGTGWRLSCSTSTLDRGVPVSTSFHKSGDSTEMPIPSLMAIINDPRMPSGVWHFYVEALFSEGAGCSRDGPKHDFRAELALQVSPGSGTP
jgi:hypothetical protein